MDEHRDIRDRRRTPSGNEIAERQRRAQDGSIAKIKKLGLCIRRGNKFTVFSDHQTRPDDLADADRRPAGHRTSNLKGNPESLWIVDPTGHMAREAVGWNHVPPDTRQQHYTRIGGVLIKPLRQPIDVDLRGDVQIVNADLHAGMDQRLGGPCKRTRKVQQDGNTSQRFLNHLRIVEREDPVFHFQLTGKFHQLRLVPPGDHEVQPGVFRLFRRHATGVAGRSIDQ